MLNKVGLYIVLTKIIEKELKEGLKQRVLNLKTKDQILFLNHRHLQKDWKNKLKIGLRKHLTQDWLL